MREVGLMLWDKLRRLNMVIAAWITLICFGWLSFLFINGIFATKVPVMHVVFTIIFIFLTAISVGIIWGGLFK